MGNWINGTDSMDDVDGEKTIVKQRSPYRELNEPVLAVYPQVYPEKQPGFSIRIYHDHTADITETFEGEVIPVLRFILSRWPEYGDIVTQSHNGLTDEVTEVTFKEIASQERKRLRNQQDWFHGTTSLYAPDILRIGLAPQDVSKRNYRGMNGSETGVVYLGSDEDTAKFHAKNAAKNLGGAPVVLKIDMTGLENRIVNDHDVRDYPLVKDHNSNDISANRVKNNPGEASYLTIGTISVKGRIPPNKISIAWQGKETVGARQKKSSQIQFVDQLASLAKQLDKPKLYDFFKIIALQPSGWQGGRVKYNDSYYADIEKTINTVYGYKAQPKQFAKWVNGMRIRAGSWRKRAELNLSGNEEAAIVQLIDATNAKINTQN